MDNKNYLNKISFEAVKMLKDVNADKIFQKKDVLKIAITGLNKSGKTVFITSLINQLLSGKRLGSLGKKKEFVAKLLPFQEADINANQEFNYRAILNGIREEQPRWPQSTASVSKAVLRLEIKSLSSFFPNKILDIEIIDYPGEWLFDLPMLDKSFEDWSEEMLSDINNSSKKIIAKDWQSEFAKFDIYGFNDGANDKNIANKYRDYLRTIHNMGFSVIQPGRNIQGGNIKDVSTLLFTPLPKPKYITPHEDSIYNRFKKRYERYILEIVTPLAEKYFSQFDRQIILVDVLKSLQNGYSAFLDMTQAMKKIIEIYSYGNQSFLKKMVDTRIDKVFFGASKADYVSSTQHQNYQNLLTTIIEDAKRELNIKGIDTKSLIFASVKSTTDEVKEFQGKNLDCLKGVLVGSEKPTIEYSGEIPVNFPIREEWKDGMFSFPKFAPTRFPDRDIDAVQHINMDLIIDYIIGDKL